MRKLGLDFGDLDAAGAFSPAADAGDDHTHHFHRINERIGGPAAADEFNVTEQLVAKGVIGVGEANRHLGLGAAHLTGTEDCAAVVDHGNRHLRAAAVDQVRHFEAGAGFEADGEESETQDTEDRLEGVNPVAIPRLDRYRGEPAQFAERGQTGDQGRELRRVAHAARGQNPRAGLFPRDEGAELLQRGGERLVHEDGQAGLHKRAGAADVVGTVIGGDEHGVDVPNHILGAGDDMRNERSFCDRRRLGGIIRPEVRDLHARNAHAFVRLGAEVGRDAGVGAAGHGGAVVAVDDGRPGIRVPVAGDHAEHGEPEGCGRWVRHGGKRTPRAGRMWRRRGRRG